MAFVGPVRLRIDFDRLARQLGEMSKVVETPPESFWENVRTHHRNRAWDIFRQNRRTGFHRDVYWREFAIQYIRQDGTVIPAWGGVPKVHGRGKVKGRLRQSGNKGGENPGRRITERSRLVRDTTYLRSMVAFRKVVFNNGRSVRLITPVSYAERQQNLRPFSFVTESDIRFYLILARRFIRESIEGVA